MFRSLITIFLLLLWGTAVAAGNDQGTFRCRPTTPDADGPFYRAGAPERSSVGKGYILSGTVRSADDCAIRPGAKIEIWLNGPDGRYGDDWRATLYAKPDGTYRFESHVPVPYGSRPPHIHLIVNAAGFKELITQHYPEQEAKAATFDLVLIPQ